MERERDSVQALASWERIKVKRGTRSENASLILLQPYACRPDERKQTLPVHYIPIQTRVHCVKI